MKTTFWVFLVVDCILLLLALWQVVPSMGARKGYYSGKYYVSWSLILLVLIGIITASWQMRYSYPGIANTLLGIPGVPGLGYGIFILAAIILKPRWN